MSVQPPTARNYVKRAQWTGVLLLTCMSAALAADKAAELSDEFLEYLGSLEGEADNWLDFADATLVKVSAPVSAASAASSAASSAAVVSAPRTSAIRSSDAKSSQSSATSTPGAADKADK